MHENLFSEHHFHDELPCLEISCYPYAKWICLFDVWIKLSVRCVEARWIRPTVQFVFKAYDFWIHARQSCLETRVHLHMNKTHLCKSFCCDEIMNFWLTPYWSSHHGPASQNEFMADIETLQTVCYFEHPTVVLEDDSAISAELAFMSTWISSSFFHGFCSVA